MSKIQNLLHSKIGPVFRGIADPDVVSVDTETFYHKKEYDIDLLGAQGYCADPRFDPYLISVWARDIQYVGPLNKCPWDKMTGRPWVSHNAGFDAAVLAEAQRRGWVPEWVEPAAWDCTADLAVYMKAPRTLSGASRELLGKLMNKETRDLMNGKTWDDAVKLGLDKQLLEYALRDAEACYELARQYGNQWPEREIRISRLNRKSCSKGMHVDSEKVEKAIKSLKHVVWMSGELIPWEWGGVKQNKTPLSLDKAREQCRKDGIPAPTTFKEDDPESTEWEIKYADIFPWIRAVRQWRKSNQLLKRLQTIERRTRSDGTFPYNLFYFGAHTGRMAGTGGINMQNLLRDPFDMTALLEGEDASLMRSIDLRSLFIAPPGKALFISDLSQIEARGLLHLVRDTKQLDKIRSGFSVYEAHARETMGWRGGELKKEDPRLYRLAKARVLGAGYGCGPSKFKTVAKIMAGIDLTPDECTETVYAFRESNPKIPDYWYRMNAGLKLSALRNEDFTVRLPSGRTLDYMQPHLEMGDLMARVQRGGPFYKFWGGVLVENITQAYARDVFMDGLLLVEEKEIADLNLQVHDEGVWLGEEANSKDTLFEIERCMSTTPPWAEGLPLGADGIVSSYYRKPD